MGGRAPKRLSDVAAVARQYGCDLVEGTNHMKFVKSGKRPYPVPAHNGMKSEISWKYIQGLCRNMDIPIEAFTGN